MPKQAGFWAGPRVAFLGCFGAPVLGFLLGKVHTLGRAHPGCVTWHFSLVSQVGPTTATLCTWAAHEFGHSWPLSISTANIISSLRVNLGVAPYCHKYLCSYCSLRQHRLLMSVIPLLVLKLQYHIIVQLLNEIIEYNNTLMKNWLIVEVNEKLGVVWVRVAVQLRRNITGGAHRPQ